MSMCIVSGGWCWPRGLASEVSARALVSIYTYIYIYIIKYVLIFYKMFYKCYILFISSGRVPCRPETRGDDSMGAYGRIKARAEHNLYKW